MRKLIVAVVIIAASSPAFAQRALKKTPPATNRVEVSAWSTPGHPEGNGSVADGGGASGGGGD